MTKKQMMALKPGDIVEEKTTGDQFKVVKLVDVRSMVETKDGKYAFVDPRKEIAVELIPGFDYSRRYDTSGPYFLFSHQRMKVKEVQA